MGGLTRGGNIVYPPKGGNFLVTPVTSCRHTVKHLESFSFQHFKISIPFSSYNKLVSSCSMHNAYEKYLAVLSSCVIPYDRLSVSPSSDTYEILVPYIAWYVSR